MEQATFPADVAFFGHSLGALVAFEVARALRDRGLEGPRCLLLSAMPAPHLPSGAPPTAGLSDEELLASLPGSHASLAEDLRADPDLAELVLPGLRADLEMVESYRHQEGPPLECRFVVTGGIDDAIGLEELQAWKRHTTGSSEVHQFPGDHFYFREGSGPLASLLEQVLISR